MAWRLFERLGLWGPYSALGEGSRALRRLGLPGFLVVGQSVLSDGLGVGVSSVAFVPSASCGLVDWFVESGPPDKTCVSRCVGQESSPGWASSSTPYRGRSWSMCRRHVGPFGMTRTLTVRVPKTFVTTAGTHRGCLLRLGPQYKA